MIDLSNAQRQQVELAAALYLPVFLAVGGWVGLRMRRDAQPARHLVACLLGMLWCVPALMLMERCNVAAGWWVFPATGGTHFLGMPAELLVGWAVLWGAVPAMLPAGISAWWKLSLFALADLLVMPGMHAAVLLRRGWLVGEAVALLLVLLPALLLQEWTNRRLHVRGRAMFQLAIAALVFLYLPLEMVWGLRGGAHHPPYPSWTRQLLWQVFALLALPGISAVQEFAQSGGGTPIPYDAPVRLVRQGVYRFVANPMQASATAAMLLWAVLWREPWLLPGPLLCMAYSLGLARADEDADLTARFAEHWKAYREQTRSWLPRWRPNAEPGAVLYMAATCETCSTVQRWILRREPRGLQMEDAASLPAGSILRARYTCSGDTVEGVRAVARALEHIHFGWALAGALLRLPPVWRVAQLALDACGMGPRTLQCSAVPATRRAEAVRVESSYGAQGRHTAKQ